MSDRIPPKLYAALANEINAWREDALIGDTLADTLIARYPVNAPRSNAVALLTVIGAVLVGLGTLLYIGANWQAIATIWKISILVAAIIASNVAGWIFKLEPGNRPRLGTAFLLLGAIFMGAGIWLVAQMFNLDINYPNGLLLWLVGAAASALVTRSSAVGILSSLILGAWTLYTTNPGFGIGSGFHVTGDYQIVLGALAGVCLAWNLRSQAMTWITLLSTSLWILLFSCSGVPGLLMWGFALFGAALWMRSNLKIHEQPFKYVGICSALGAILILTCDRESWLSHSNAVNYYSLVSAAVVMQIFLLLKMKEYRTEAFGCLLLLGYFLFFAVNSVELGRVVAFNFMAIGGIFGLAWVGARRLQSPGCVNTAIVFAVFYIICRYFDLFFSMMDRSLFFVVGGVALMTVGALAERGRRELIGSMPL